MITKRAVFLIYFLLNAMEYQALVELNETVSKVKSAVNSLPIFKMLKSLDETNGEETLDTALKVLHGLCNCYKGFYNKIGVEKTVEEFLKSVRKYLLYMKLNILTNDELDPVVENKLKAIEEEVTFLLDKNIGDDNINTRFKANRDCFADLHKDNEKMEMKHKKPMNLKNIIDMSLVKTRRLHNYSLRKMKKFVSKHNFTRENFLNTSLIILLTITSANANISLENDIDENVINSELNTEFPIAIDVIDIKHSSDNDFIENNVTNKNQNMSLCSVALLHTFLTDSIRHKTIKTFNVTRKDGNVKIYVEVSNATSSDIFDKDCIDLNGTMDNLESTIHEKYYNHSFDAICSTTQSNIIHEILSKHFIDDRNSTSIQIINPVNKTLSNGVHLHVLHNFTITNTNHTNNTKDKSKTFEKYKGSVSRLSHLLKLYQNAISTGQIYNFTGMLPTTTNTMEDSSKSTLAPHSTSTEPNILNSGVEITTLNTDNSNIIEELSKSKEHETAFWNIYSEFEPDKSALADNIIIDTKIGDNATQNDNNKKYIGAGIPQNKNEKNILEKIMEGQNNKDSGFHMSYSESTIATDTLTDTIPFEINETTMLYYEVPTRDKNNKNLFEHALVSTLKEKSKYFLDENFEIDEINEVAKDVKDKKLTEDFIYKKYDITPQLTDRKSNKNLTTNNEQNTSEENVLINKSKVSHKIQTLFEKFGNHSLLSILDVLNNTKIKNNNTKIPLSSENDNMIMTDFSSEIKLNQVSQSVDNGVTNMEIPSYQKFTLSNGSSHNIVQDVTILNSNKKEDKLLNFPQSGNSSYSNIYSNDQRIEESTEKLKRVITDTFSTQKIATSISEFISQEFIEGKNTLLSENLDNLKENFEGKSVSPFEQSHMNSKTYPTVETSIDFNDEITGIAYGDYISNNYHETSTSYNKSMYEDLKYDNGYLLKSIEITTITPFSNKIPWTIWQNVTTMKVMKESPNLSLPIQSTALIKYGEDNINEGNQNVKTTPDSKAAEMTEQSLFTTSHLATSKEYMTNKATGISNVDPLTQWNSIPFSPEKVTDVMENNYITPSITSENLTSGRWFTKTSPLYILKIHEGDKNIKKSMTEKEDKMKMTTYTSIIEYKPTSVGFKHNTVPTEIDVTIDNPKFINYSTQYTSTNFEDNVGLILTEPSTVVIYDGTSIETSTFPIASIYTEENSDFLTQESADEDKINIESSRLPFEYVNEMTDNSLANLNQSHKKINSLNAKDNDSNSILSIVDKHLSDQLNEPSPTAAAEIIINSTDVVWSNPLFEGGGEGTKITHKNITEKWNQPIFNNVPLPKMLKHSIEDEKMSTSNISYKITKNTIKNTASSTTMQTDNTRIFLDDSQRLQSSLEDCFTTKNVPETIKIGSGLTHNFTEYFNDTHDNLNSKPSLDVAPDQVGGIYITYVTRKQNGNEKVDPKLEQLGSTSTSVSSTNNKFNEKIDLTQQHSSSKELIDKNHELELSYANNGHNSLKYTQSTEGLSTSLTTIKNASQTKQSKTDFYNLTPGNEYSTEIFVSVTRPVTTAKTTIMMTTQNMFTEHLLAIYSKTSRETTTQSADLNLNTKILEGLNNTTHALLYNPKTITLKERKMVNDIKHSTLLIPTSSFEEDATAVTKPNIKTRNRYVTEKKYEFHTEHGPPQFTAEFLPIQSNLDNKSNKVVNVGRVPKQFTEKQKDKEQFKHEFQNESKLTSFSPNKTINKKGDRHIQPTENRIISIEVVTEVVNPLPINKSRLFHLPSVTLNNSENHYEENSSVNSTMNFKNMTKVSDGNIFTLNYDATTIFNEAINSEFFASSSSTITIDTDFNSDKSDHNNKTFINITEVTNNITLTNLVPKLLNLRLINNTKEDYFTDGIDTYKNLSLTTTTTINEIDDINVEPHEDRKTVQNNESMQSDLLVTLKPLFSSHVNLLESDTVAFESISKIPDIFMTTVTADDKFRDFDKTGIKNTNLSNIITNNLTLSSPSIHYSNIETPPNVNESPNNVTETTEAEDEMNMTYLVPGLNKLTTKQKEQSKYFSTDNFGLTKPPLNTIITMHETQEINMATPGNTTTFPIKELKQFYAPIKLISKPFKSVQVSSLASNLAFKGINKVADILPTILPTDLTLYDIVNSTLPSTTSRNQDETNMESVSLLTTEMLDLNSGISDIYNLNLTGISEASDGINETTIPKFLPEMLILTTTNYEPLKQYSNDESKFKIIYPISTTKIKEIEDTNFKISESNIHLPKQFDASTTLIPQLEINARPSNTEAFEDPSKLPYTLTTSSTIDLKTHGADESFIPTNTIIIQDNTNNTESVTSVTTQIVDINFDKPNILNKTFINMTESMYGTKEVTTLNLVPELLTLTTRYNNNLEYKSNNESMVRKLASTTTTATNEIEYINTETSENRPSFQNIELKKCDATTTRTLKPQLRKSYEVSSLKSNTELFEHVSIVPDILTTISTVNLNLLIDVKSTFQNRVSSFSEMSKNTETVTSLPITMIDSNFDMFDIPNQTHADIEETADDKNGITVTNLVPMSQKLIRKDKMEFNYFTADGTDHTQIFPITVKMIKDIEDKDAFVKSKPLPKKELEQFELSFTVTEWWQDDMYMKVRNPLPVHSNPGMVFPPRKFNKVDDVADLGALFIDDLLDYKEMLDKGDLPLERATNREKGQPLCMEQFYKLLGVCRVPDIGKDRLELPPVPQDEPIDSLEEHVVVACRNHFYIIPVKAADRGRLSPGEVKAQLLHVLVDAAGAPKAPPVGLLTAMHRDTWAKARDLLAREDNNLRNLELMSRALCVLCLDEDGGDRIDADADTNAMLRAMHGAGTRHHSANRWFDKTVQLIISSDGTVGMCYEHSAAEGVAVIRLAERMLARADVSPPPAPPPALLPPPERMTWTLPSEIQKYMDQAAVSIDRQIEDLDFKVYTYRGYGREFMKSCKTSPDVYIQLALQYAYYKMYGRLVSTYESASLRRFRAGRVDNIRSAHKQARDWAAAMCAAESPAAQDTDDPAQKKVSFNLYGEQKKQELFEAAARKQTEIMVANILGQGIDNHLLGLREAGREMLEGKLPDIFSDDTYQQAIEFKLSTSQVTTTTDGTFMGYGPVVPDGYGCSYNPKKDSVIFCIASYTSSDLTNTEAFRLSLEEALEAMRLMFQQANTAEK